MAAVDVVTDYPFAFGAGDPFDQIFISRAVVEHAEARWLELEGNKA